jgi:hypothetical protein
LISGILEDEGESFHAYILGLERHIAYIPPYNFENLKECSEYIYPTGLQGISLSVATGAAIGMETETKKHGDFDDNPATLRSMEAILI